MRYAKFLIIALAILFVAGCAQMAGITDKLLGDKKGTICQGFKAVLDVDVSGITNPADKEKAIQGQKTAADVYAFLKCQ